MDLWKQMSSSKCSFTCICGIFWPVNPSTTTVYARSAFFPSLHFTLSLQSAFYTQSAFYPYILPLVRSLQSAVRSPQSSSYTDRKGNENGTLFVLYTFVITVRLLEPEALGRRVSNHNVFVFVFFFWKQKILKYFFANGPIKFKVQQCNRWKL